MWYPNLKTRLYMDANTKLKRDWESQFETWSKPPGKTEQTRCDNAVSIVRNAINRWPKLANRSIKIFPQGSYRNRVNVRHDSDVDIGVLCSDTFFYHYPPDMSDSDFGISTAPYQWPEFKNDVEDALVDYLGRDLVHRGNKAFDIKENTYHVDADVVPLFEYRQYWKHGGYRAGVALQTDRESRRIENYPEILLPHWPSTPLHYENGVTKNTASIRRYKGLVRILKSLRNEMADNSIAEADPIPGFLIECLAWNTPDTHFSHNSWNERVKSTLLYLWSNTESDETCKAWFEVNNIKYLFHASQPWTRVQANGFLLSAWIYVEKS